ncbi:flagellin [Pseudoxanthomonas sp. CF385]|uniref:flagellin n=1 Tax=Pseudoxanthomonas sp. CF385 TaxID=1881042 RepID=UPI00089098D8|nr:flagellin [Pseudoxanthomonas sp. CF385]SDR12887.1 flagellin [Pseudoxanthomonas sp. CF385]
MAQVINTNTISLNAQRNLSTSGASLATTIQRLSSGLRINSAKDDAAGLAISERFSTQIRGLDVAVRNANDGISLAQVAEGSLTEIGNNLQRIRELSVQSANATNSSSDRAALNAEVKQLTSEIDRVAKQADFNGTKLLDGSFTSQLFQVGANAGQAIAIDKVVDAKAGSLGGAMFATATFTTATPADGVTALKIDGLQLTNADGATVTIDTVDVAAQGTAAGTRDAAAKALVTAINAKIGESGVYAELGAAGAVSLTSVKDSVGTNGAFKGIAIETGTWTGGTAPADVTASTVATTKQYASNLDISTFKGAQQALEIVDKALTSVNSARADLGAVQNRFTSVVANLQTSSENLAASRSRIRDTDFAKETAELTRTQILQQAGTAMLAQANQVPQNVLSLLR